MDKSDLEIDQIVIDENGYLQVKPKLSSNEDFQFIWRDATGIRWDHEKRCLIAYEPEKWDILNLYKQILSALSNEYGKKMILTSNTKWISVPENLIKQIKEFMLSNNP